MDYRSRKVMLLRKPIDDITLHDNEGVVSGIWY